MKKKFNLSKKEQGLHSMLTACLVSEEFLDAYVDYTLTVYGYVEYWVEDVVEDDGRFIVQLGYQPVENITLFEELFMNKILNMDLSLLISLSEDGLMAHFQELMLEAMAETKSEPVYGQAATATVRVEPIENSYYCNYDDLEALSMWFLNLE